MRQWASPSFAMTAKTASTTAVQTSTGTFGTATQRITVDNPGASSTGWTLTLSPGNYEICVEHILPSSQVLADDTTQEMLVSAYTTGTPSVNSVNWIGGQPIITGWYDAENTVYLRVFVVDRWYVLGQDSQLTVNGNSWKLNLSQLDPVLKLVLIQWLFKRLVVTAQYLLAIHRPT